MTSIPQVAKALRTVLTRIANRAARTTRCVRRRSKLRGAKFVQTLVVGWLANPEATYEELAQTAATVGVKVTAQGVEQRFSEAAAQCLERVLQAALHQGIRFQQLLVLLRAEYRVVEIHPLAAQHHGTDRYALLFLVQIRNHKRRLECADASRLIVPRKKFDHVLAR